MSNTQRPKLGMKTPAQREKEQMLESGLALTLDIDGKERRFEVRFGDLTPALTRELRLATGMGYTELLRALNSTPDVDLVQAFIWLARRVDGELLDISQVEVDFSHVLQFADGNRVEGIEPAETDEGDEGDPEA